MNRVQKQKERQVSLTQAVQLESSHQMRTKHMKKVLTKEKWDQAARFTAVVPQERSLHINSREGLSLQKKTHP